MKFISTLRILVLFVLFFAKVPSSFSQSFGQVPQYFNARPSVTNPGIACFVNPNYDTTPARRIQLIYKPSFSFPTVPNGYIKAIYFRSGHTTSGKYNNPGFAYNVIFSLGWSKKDTFRKLNQNIPSLRDTFITGLTPVGNIPVLRENVNDSGFYWMRFPTSGTPFYYSGQQEGQNLVVEMVFGPPFINNYFCLFDSGGGNPQKMMMGYRDTPYVYANYHDLMANVFGAVDFGFDLTPVGVEAGMFSGDFSLFPNPSKGSFHIDVDALKALEQVDVTVKSITGQTVYRQHYNPGSSNFSTEINLQNAAKGMYYLEMMAD